MTENCRSAVKGDRRNFDPDDPGNQSRSLPFRPHANMARCNLPAPTAGEVNGTTSTGPVNSSNQRSHSQVTDATLFGTHAVQIWYELATAMLHASRFGPVFSMIERRRQFVNRIRVAQNWKQLFDKPEIVDEQQQKGKVFVCDSELETYRRHFMKPAKINDSSEIEKSENWVTSNIAIFLNNRERQVILKWRSLVKAYVRMVPPGNWERLSNFVLLKQRIRIAEEIVSTS